MAQTGSRPIDELVRRAIIGDGTAFTELWDSNIGALRAYLGKALGMEHSRQATAAQNAVTEATNELLRKNADMLKMGTIATAKEAERSVIDIETLQHTNDQLISTLDEVIKTETRSRTESMIDRLPELYREIARLRLIEGMQYKEIAEETGLELNTVRTRIRRAKMLLDKMKV